MNASKRNPASEASFSSFCIVEVFEVARSRYSTVPGAAVDCALADGADGGRRTNERQRGAASRGVKVVILSRGWSSAASLHRRECGG
jgi:hypothetical protein